MGTGDLKLRRPPIVEAIVDIECDFAPGYDVKALEEPARTEFAADYPTLRHRFLHELRISANAEGGPDHSARQALNSLMLLKEDEKQLVQIRATGYSFNRLAPYLSFDAYLPEIRQTWDLFRMIAKPVQVTGVNLRYINRIVLPTRQDGNVELDDYFRVGPRLPDEEQLIFTGFLNQYTAVEHDTRHQVKVVLSTTEPQQLLATESSRAEDGTPVIFDNTAAAMASLDPKDWKSLEAILRSLRGLKNRVFKNTLTEHCLSLFQ